MESSAEVTAMEDESESNLEPFEEVLVTAMQEVQDELLTMECSADVGTMEDKSEGDVLEPLEEVLVTVRQEVMDPLLLVECSADVGTMEHEGAGPLVEVLVILKQEQDPLLECSTLAGGNGSRAEPQEQSTAGCNCVRNEVAFVIVEEENVPADAAVLPSNNVCEVCSLDPADCQHLGAQSVPRQFEDKAQGVPMSSWQLGDAGIDSMKTIFQESELVKTSRDRTWHRSFICKKCSESIFKVHSYPISCQCCDKTYSQENLLAVHKMKHTGERPFTCKICYKSFFWKDHLDKHKTIHTRDSSENKEKKRILKSQGNAFLKCHLCSMFFTEKQILTFYKLIHAGERPFSCGLCGRSFIQNADLKLHVKTHEGVRLFKCTICSTSFSERRKLVFHMRSHTAKLCVRCSRCKKSFVGLIDCTMHTRGHRGQYPYMCETCGRMFLHNQSLILHIATHRGDFSCEVCCKSFLRSSDLARHTLFVHKTR